MRRRRGRWLRWRAQALVALLVMLPALEPAYAQSTQDSASIDAGAARAGSGRIAINQAAGNGNAQVNLAAIAFDNAGAGQAQLRATQRTPGITARRADAAARIGAQAFAQTHGALALNQSAGDGNHQRNLIAIGMQTAISAADDAALAGTAGETEPGATATAPPSRQAVIADGAFDGSRGVVQVNQTAGVGNSATNAIVLQLPGGTP